MSDLAQKTGPTDTEIVNWLETNAFTAYHDRDPETGDFYSDFVVVLEDRKMRSGILGKTFRGAVWAAMVEGETK